MASEEEAMAYSRGAVERAMKVQEVILRAIDGKLTWVQAADILGYSPRTIRRIRWRLQHYGYDGLLDRRRQTPDRKSTRLNSSHSQISYAVFCLKKKKTPASSRTSTCAYSGSYSRRARVLAM